MMNKEKYLQKIKKLLNLAKRNSNPNESASALRQAQNLMREHNLTSTDVELTEITSASSKSAPSDAVSMPRYMVSLGQVICRAFGVQVYYSWRYTPRGIPKRILTFYGPAERSVVASFAFDVLSRQMVKARSEYLAGQRKNIKAATKTARADTFCESWVSGAHAVISKFVITDDEQALMTSYYQRLKERNSFTQASMREAKACRGDNDASIRVTWLVRLHGSIMVLMVVHSQSFKLG
ncbi:DUF2786 domain-containing protein [Limnobaculum xujianqingii]|uniref:DUF2786 domain-containing protein n=1 Tax=Limnobaculum xujianqingii TaxID=2738837 RepID=UPI001E4C51A5|nr:DUF2786 domain-containing protein [Limnobaculum xujianqingii]